MVCSRKKKRQKRNKRITKETEAAKVLTFFRCRIGGIQSGSSSQPLEMPGYMVCNINVSIIHVFLYK